MNVLHFIGVFVVLLLYQGMYIKNIFKKPPPTHPPPPTHTKKKKKKKGGGGGKE